MEPGVEFFGKALWAWPTYLRNQAHIYIWKYDIISLIVLILYPCQLPRRLRIPNFVGVSPTKCRMSLGVSHYALFLSWHCGDVCCRRSQCTVRRGDLCCLNSDPKSSILPVSVRDFRHWLCTHSDRVTPFFSGSVCMMDRTGIGLWNVRIIGSDIQMSGFCTHNAKLPC